jgi:ubiquitin related modifier 1
VSNSGKSIKALIYYSGGLETLFDGKKSVVADLEGKSGTLESLIDVLRRDHLRDKEEMFVQGNSVRPGIIVLVNDTDWELLDTVKYQIQPTDSVAFISTLHGG